MIVYADILLTVNLIVDFFLLKVSLKLLKIKPKTFRLITSSIIGALFSLYIFLPDSSPVIEFFVHLAMSCVMILICIGFNCIKSFVRSVIILFTVTCIYAGAMIAFWQIFKPKGMLINNSMVYFNISPTILIGFTVIGYFLYIFFSKIFDISSGNAKRCSITLYALGKSVGATAIIDTGNSLVDIFSDSEIIIADKTVALALFSETDILKDALIATRYRSIPCGTVSGESILDGFRCDMADIYLENKIISLNNPILAISKTSIKDDYSVILNPKILKLEGKKYETAQKFSV